MAYSVMATTTDDAQILAKMKTIARRRNLQVSKVVRDAFLAFIAANNGKKAS